MPKIPDFFMNERMNEWTKTEHDASEVIHQWEFNIIREITDVAFVFVIL